MIKKFTITLELADGRVLGPERILAADRIAAESLSRRRGWDFEEGPRLYSAIAWSVCKRIGASSAEYEEFLDELVDWSVEALEGEASENPTE